jgi:hypothetical protein
MHVTTLITRKHSTTYIVLGGERILVSELGASPLEGQPTKSTVKGGGGAGEVAGGCCVGTAVAIYGRWDGPPPRSPFARIAFRRRRCSAGTGRITLQGASQQD